MKRPSAKRSNQEIRGMPAPGASSLISTYEYVCICICAHVMAGRRSAENGQVEGRGISSSHTVADGTEVKIYKSDRIEFEAAVGGNPGVTKKL